MAKLNDKLVSEKMFIKEIHSICSHRVDEKIETKINVINPLNYTTDLIISN